MQGLRGASQTVVLSLPRSPCSAISPHHSATLPSLPRTALVLATCAQASEPTPAHALGTAVPSGTVAACFARQRARLVTPDLEPKLLASASWMGRCKENHLNCRQGRYVSERGFHQHIRLLRFDVSRLCPSPTRPTFRWQMLAALRGSDVQF